MGCKKASRKKKKKKTCGRHACGKTSGRGAGRKASGPIQEDAGATCTWVRVAKGDWCGGEGEGVRGGWQAASGAREREHKRAATIFFPG